MIPFPDKDTELLCQFFGPRLIPMSGFLGLQTHTFDFRPIFLAILSLSQCRKHGDPFDPDGDYNEYSVV